MDEHATSQPRHRSTHADHPAIKGVLPPFIARLPEHVRNLRALVAAGDVDGLRLVAHKLKGAGKSFGFEGITQHAAVIEEIILAGGGMKEAAGPVAALIAYLENVEGYTRP